VKRNRARERRRFVRYRVDSECACQAVLVLGEERWPGRVRNVSVGGVCLMMDSPFPPGTRCVLDLVNQVGLFAVELPMEIVHVSRTEDRNFLLGCAFVEKKLTIDDVRAILS
jgi:hypothetical protein